MILQAVTVCINYADYLRYALSNRAEFDRWVVVTCPADTATRELCREHGIEVIITEAYETDGRTFNAANNKSAGINAGLEVLDQAEWVMLIDADVVLPPGAGDRLRAARLQREVLYGPVSRRVVSPDELVLLSLAWPHPVSPAPEPVVIGYCGLFHLGNKANRYLPSARGGKLEHDDIRFASQYHEKRNRRVPLCVLHVGQPGSDWHGRKSGNARGASESIHAATTRRLDAYFERVATLYKPGRVLILGGQANSVADRAAGLFREVVVCDILSPDSRHPMTSTTPGRRGRQAWQRTCVRCLVTPWSRCQGGRSLSSWRWNWMFIFWRIC